MLYFILAWTGLLIASFLVGTVTLQLCRGYTLDRLCDRVSLSVWLGLVVLSIALMAASLRFSLSAPVGAVVILGLSSLACLQKQTRAEIAAVWAWLSWSRGLGYGAAAAAISALMAQPVTWLDTGLYHAGLIRWLFEFGTVPGLALLNSQFGFISTWFAIAAPFNAPFPAGQAAAVMNGFVLLIAVLQLGLSLAQVMLRKARSSDWFSLVFLLIVCLAFTQTHFLSVILLSPSPDIPVILLTGTVAWLILLLHEQNSRAFAEVIQTPLSPDLLPLLLAIGATSIKLTALPLLAFSLGFYLLRKMSWGRWIAGGLILGLALLPFLTASTLTSGCPLFPSTFGCLDLPWTHSAESTVRIANQTHGWQTWFGQPPPGANRYLWLLGKWLQSSNSNKLIAPLLVAIPIYLLFAIGQARHYRPPSRAYAQIWLVLLAAVGTLFMMLKAPMFRFGMGYVLLVPCLLAMTCLQKQACAIGDIRQLSWFYKRSRWAIGLAVSAALLAMITVRSGPSHLLLPPPLPASELEVLQPVGEVAYQRPLNSRRICWSAELPCVREVSPRIGLRNTAAGLDAGFMYVR